jgi:formylglycine-generating enzyme required for sulfatase activity
MASSQPPRELISPKGGVRPFTFEAEIQPILDKRCVGCHNGAEPTRPNFKDTSLDPVVQMSQSYLNLHPYVRRQGPEADLHTMQPMEYHVSTSELIRNLRNGHHNVQLDEAEWQSLYKWIDFNTPYNGTFQATASYQGCDQEERRMELAQKYSNIKVDWRQELGIRIKQLKQVGHVDPVIPKPLPPLAGPHKKAAQWGFDAAEAQNMQAKNGSYRKVVLLKNGQSMTLVRIPAGTYFKTDPVSGKAIKTKIDQAFWMGTTEVTNAQFQTLFPKHDSRFINQFWKDHVNEGYPANKPGQPVIRVSYEEAMDFCEQLGAQLGKKVRLPHVSEWEWAARAGNVTDMPFDATADFSAYANLADVSLRDMAVTGVDPKPMAENNRLRPYYDFVPRSQTINDGQMIVAEVGQYQPNAFGLYDMIGNVAEWTQTEYNKPLWAPFAFDEGYKTAKGYSWRDRASIVSFGGAEAYLPWQKVYNVGFRVVIEE